MESASKGNLKGLNFSRAKYKVVNNKVFIPHIRSSFYATIPIEILEHFNAVLLKEPVALVRIKSKDTEILRIKKLSKAANSLVFSLNLFFLFPQPV